MTDESAFLRAIVDDPDDATNRLVYADWLEEHGEAARGEFLRTHLACDRLKCLDPFLDSWRWEAYCATMWRGRDWDRSRGDFIRWLVEYGWCSEEGDDLSLIKSRPEELLEKHGPAWAKKVKPLVSGFGFRRGLLERVRLTPQQLLKNAKKLFRLAPILDVTLIPTGQGDTEAIAEVLKLPQLAQLTHLHFAGLFAMQSEDLARATHLRRLQSLWLVDTHIDTEGLELLADCEHLANLTDLHLQGNYLTPKGIGHLTSSKYLTRLRSLYLGCNAVDVQGARLLAEWPGLAQLRALDLSLCQLGDEGLRLLASSKRLANLRWLYLNNNDIASGGIRALAKADLSEVRVLDLSDNSLEDDEVATLSRAKHLAHLGVLELADNLVESPGVAALARSRTLAKDNGLFCLSLRGNILAGDGLRALVRSKALWRLTYLDLSDCSLTAADIAKLAGESKMKLLSTLDLSRNSIEDEGVIALANWKGMEDVSILNLRNVDMTDAGAEALATSSHLYCLCILDVQHNDLSRAAIESLQERFGEEWVIADA